MTRLVGIADAAAALGVHPATLRRWLRQGAPQARSGRRGRGGAALVDVDAVALWRQPAQQHDPALVFASEIPELVAEAMMEAHCRIDGPDKRRAAGYLAAAGYLVITQLLDHLRRDCAAVPELVELPRKLRMLRDINRQSA